MSCLTLTAQYNAQGRPFTKMDMLMPLGTLTFEPAPGSTLDEAIRGVLTLVNDFRQGAVLIFDGAAVDVAMDATPEKVAEQVRQHRLRRRSANDQADLERLVRELTEMTRAGRVRWGPSSQDGLFRTLDLKSGIVRVGKWRAGHFDLYLGDQSWYGCVYQTNTSIGHIPGLAELYAEVAGRVHDEGITRFLDELQTLS